MKNLPLGVSDFKYLRRQDLNIIYVDKTEHIYRMLKTGQQYYFLSRPRRFGKSLLVSTLKALFEGRKELFKGLYIEDKWDFEPYPVIHINFAGGEFKSDKFLWERVDQNLRVNQEQLGVSTSKDLELATRFYDLIYEVYKKYNQRVVVLIDEYDKPLIDTLTDAEQLERNRQTLRGIYSVLKEVDMCLRFVFITGVSKFSQVSLFSGLNNLRDISFLARYSTICGYTQEELEQSFAEYLVGVDMEKIKMWYDGYSFMAKDKKDHVYAPYDVLLYLDEKEDFEAYWFNTSTPTFLVNLLRERREKMSLPDLEEVTIKKTLLSVNEISSMPLAALLFQTGYLTMRGEQDLNKRGYLRVGIPNHSVRIALADQLVVAVAGEKETLQWVDEGRDALSTGNLEVIADHWNVLFSSLSYDNTSMKKLEAYYRNHAFTYCHMLDVDVRMEVHTDKGRIDMVIQHGNWVYVCEFKTVKSGEDPLQQIHTMGYAEMFKGQGKQIVSVGVLCNPQPDKEKGESVVKLVWEKYA